MQAQILTQMSKANPKDDEDLMPPTVAPVQKGPMSKFVQTLKDKITSDVVFVNENANLQPQGIIQAALRVVKLNLQV